MSESQKIMCLNRKYVSQSQKERRPQDTLVSKNVSESQKERRPQIYFSVQNLERESEFERGRKKFKINGVLSNTPLIALLYSECTLIKMLFRTRIDRYFTSFAFSSKFRTHFSHVCASPLPSEVPHIHPATTDGFLNLCFSQQGSYQIYVCAVARRGDTFKSFAF